MADNTLESAWRAEVYKLWKEIEVLQAKIRVKDGHSLPERDCNFGDALQHLKAGKRVTRKCWRNNQVYLYLWEGAAVQTDDGHLPELRVKTIQGKHAPWMPNHSELLADDWMVV